MEIPGIPELNKTTIEEKKESEKDQNSLTTRNAANPHFNAGFFGKTLVAALLVFAMVVFFLDHIATPKTGTGYGTVAPVDSRMINK